MGCNPPEPQRGPGLVPNIFNPINLNQQPQGNVRPQGNNAEPNVPPYGQDPYRNPGGQGQEHPTWKIPGGYHPLRQYQGSNPMGPFLPRPHDPKLSKYDESLSWHAYELKLEHMANQNGWDDGTKLANLVEALEGKALNYYGTLDEVICGNYRLVCQKFNARFFPREPAHTACNQLSVLTQKDDEELEEFAEQAL